MAEIHAAITGVHGWLPEDKLTNHDLAQMVETNDEWITERTGIKERRILKGKEQGVSVIGINAVNGLCEKVGLDPKDIDLLICATVTPDHVFPATANIICDGVGATNAWSFDLGAACSGFLYALNTASQFIKAGTHKKVVVVGADKMSSIIDYTDRTTCIIFGDGGGAVLLEPDENGNGLQDAVLYSDGAGKKHLHQKGGGSWRPSSWRTVDNKDHFVYQEGQPVFKFAVTRMADASAEIMERNNLSGDDVAYLAAHQANKRIIDATARRMGIDDKKVMLNIHRYGNTTSGTIPLLLWEWENKLKKGDNLVLAAFGGGFTWGAIYMKWAYDTPSS